MRTQLEPHNCKSGFHHRTAMEPKCRDPGSLQSYTHEPEKLGSSYTIHDRGKRGAGMLLSLPHLTTAITNKALGNAFSTEEEADDRGDW